jgi:hypothetical protein
MYKHCLHHLPGGKKPKLNPGCIYKHNKLVKQLFKIDFQQNVFIDKANKRSEYSIEKCWHSPEEYLHPDVKQKTQKQNYSKAEFISTIK